MLIKTKSSQEEKSTEGVEGSRESAPFWTSCCDTDIDIRDCESFRLSFRDSKERRKDSLSIHCFRLSTVNGVSGHMVSRSLQEDD